MKKFNTFKMLQIPFTHLSTSKVGDDPLSRRSCTSLSWSVSLMEFKMPTFSIGYIGYVSDETLSVSLINN